MKKHVASSSSSKKDGKARKNGQTASALDKPHLFYTHDDPRWRIKGVGETHNKHEHSAVLQYESALTCGRSLPKIEALIVAGIEEDRPFVATASQLNTLAKAGNKTVQRFLENATIGLKSTLGISVPPRASLLFAPQHNLQ